MNITNSKINSLKFLKCREKPCVVDIKAGKLKMKNLSLAEMLTVIHLFGY